MKRSDTKQDRFLLGVLIALLALSPSLQGASAQESPVITSTVVTNAASNGSFELGSWCSLTDTDVFFCNTQHEVVWPFGYVAPGDIEDWSHTEQYITTTIDGPQYRYWDVDWYQRTQASLYGGPYLFNAKEGTRFVDLLGRRDRRDTNYYQREESRGDVIQDVPTTPGQVYRIDFWFAQPYGNYPGIGKDWNDDSNLQLHIDGNPNFAAKWCFGPEATAPVAEGTDPLLPYPVMCPTFTSSPYTSLYWHPGEYTFTATTTTTQIRFRIDKEDENGPWGVLLDDVSVVATDGDADDDGWPDDYDNCPITFNPDRSDFDHDGIGDVCDPDMDDDGQADSQDGDMCVAGDAATGDCVPGQDGRLDSKADVVVDLYAAAAVCDSPADHRLRAAADLVNQSLAPDLWSNVNTFSLNPETGRRVFDLEFLASRLMDEAEGILGNRVDGAAETCREAIDVARARLIAVDLTIIEWLRADLILRDCAEDAVCFAHLQDGDAHRAAAQSWAVGLSLDHAIDKAGDAWEEYIKGWGAGPVTPEQAAVMLRNEDARAQLQLIGARVAARGLLGAGANAVSTVAEPETAIPVTATLEANYPNPFNPVTTIRFALPEAANASLVVYDVMGREVATLVDGLTAAGRHEVRFSAGSLPSGVYLYRLVTPKTTLTGRMTLVK